MSDQDGILLTRPELLTLLDAVNANDLVGVDTDALLPDSRQEHGDLVLEGIERLKKRSLLEVIDDVNVIKPELVAIMQIFAHPQLAVVIRKQVPDLGEQRIMYYQREVYIVEHTMPDSEHFRFATIPNTLAMINRIEFFLPIPEGAPTQSFEEMLDQRAYVGVKWLVEQGQVDEAETVFNNEGLPEGASHLLVQALAAHDFAATMAFVRVENGQIVDARELEVVRTPELSWLVLHRAADANEVVVKTTHRETYLSDIFDLLRSLVSQA